jgi:hypothetical protein
MRIVDGLPPGTTLEIDAVLADFANIVEAPGGTLGGMTHLFEAWLHWDVTGTGDLTGFSRTLAIFVEGEIHTGPRNPGDPVQDFAQVLFDLHGIHYGDPDFCALTVAAGDVFGLPSPGHCTLTQLPSGDFAVDSFFDVTYRIEFEGCPGSILEDLSGTTIDTDRFQAGEPYFPPVDHDCQLPDNGLGTVTIPPDCPEGFKGPMQIVDGLPPGTTLEIDAVLTDFANIVEAPGGTLGGMTHLFEAWLHWDVSGTGELAGFARTLAIFVEGEIHTGPRNPGDPIQEFEQVLFDLHGTHYGDPDFCVLSVAAGNVFGLPSPGHCTLTELPSGDFAVDSFFDVTYRIEFEGCPGSQLEDLSGVTLDTRRFHAGEPYVTAVPDMGEAVGLRLSNHPNPFNPRTTIIYEVPVGAGQVSLEIYDLRGQHVRTLARGRPEAGVRTAVWNGDDASGRRVAAGVYICALRTERGTQYRKLALIK